LEWSFLQSDIQLCLRAATIKSTHLDKAADTPLPGNFLQELSAKSIRNRSTTSLLLQGTLLVLI
jgi:hypothetical protein